MKKIILAIILAIFPLIALAQGSHPGGASLVTPGKYAGELPGEGGVHYYKISVIPGQSLKAYVEFQAIDKNAEGTMRVFDPRRRVHPQFLKTISVNQLQKGEAVAYWMPGREKDFDKPNELYVSLESPVRVRYNLELSLLDFFDADSGGDAGNVKELALKIVPGDYKSFFSDKDKGNDFEDVYRFHLAKGEKCEIKVSRTDEHQAFEMFLFDVVKNRGIEQGELVPKKLHGGDDIVFSCEATDDGDFYFTIRMHSKHGAAPGGYYNISLKTGKEAEVLAPAEEEKIPAVTEEISKKKIWPWVVVGIVIVLFLAGGIVFIIKRKKTPPTSTPPPPPATPSVPPTPPPPPTPTPLPSK